MKAFEVICISILFAWLAWFFGKMTIELECRAYLERTKGVLYEDLHTPPECDF